LLAGKPLKTTERRGVNMTIEQKFMTMCNIGVDGLPTNEINLDVAISICKEAIKEAKMEECKEWLEIFKEWLKIFKGNAEGVE
jgi:hypothetical protein